MAQQWRDVLGYDGIYQVSDFGQVRNTQTSKILQLVKIKNGHSNSDSFRFSSDYSVWMMHYERATLLEGGQIR
jgi:hypothetical protein